MNLLPPTSLALCMALAWPLAAHAQTDHSGHHAPAAAVPSHPTPATAPATAADASTEAASLPWAEAEVRRIDDQAGKISLRHGPIANLEMPPMTMVFQVQDRSLLARAKPGDRVRFTADKVNGQYTVLQLEPAS